MANIELSLADILPVYLPDRLYLTAAGITGDKYCIFCWVQNAAEN